MEHNSEYKYLIIGSGRLATHLSSYFRQINQANKNQKIVFSHWNRKEGSLDELNNLLSQSTHILLAIKDDALSAFYQKHLATTNKVVIHFSGALSQPNMICTHPLMSFGPDSYSLMEYEKIHFVVSNSQSLQSVFPAFKNSFTILPDDKKALYHAYCVLAGNFPVLLFSEVEKEFSKLNIPPDKAKYYFEKSCMNYLKYGKEALTGPLIRNDASSIKSNLNSILKTPYHAIYQAFLKLRGLNEYF